MGKAFEGSVKVMRKEQGMKLWIFCSVVLFVISMGGNAGAIEGFSGSTWGTVFHEAAEDETFALGNISQGIDWLSYKGFRLTTFAQFRYRFQSPRGETFNAYGPSLGISVEKWGLELGTEYIWQYRDTTQSIEDGPRIFLEWYYGWDLKKLVR